MGNTTTSQAIELVARALRAGLTFTLDGYTGCTVLTAGPDVRATGPTGLAAYWYRGRGVTEETHRGAHALDAALVADWIVRRAGRGNAGRAAREALARAGLSTEIAAAPTGAPRSVARVGRAGGAW